jgi:small subunit ribosomal protein S2
MESQLRREMRKIKRNLDGIRNMHKLPGALVVIDVLREQTAVREARKLGIPTICLIDTDSDPDQADLPIPGNDDAMRAIELVLTLLADSVEEGRRGRTQRKEEAPGGEERGGPRRRTSRPTTARNAGAEDESAREAAAAATGVEVPPSGE